MDCCGSCRPLDRPLAVTIRSMSETAIYRHDGHLHLRRQYARRPRSVESLSSLEHGSRREIAPKVNTSVPKGEALKVFAMKKSSCCALLLVSLSVWLLSCGGGGGGGGGSNSGGMACNAQPGTSCQSLIISGV